MAGITQTPVSFVRLDGEPLDSSLTFDTLSNAKDYINKESTKGAPYEGQIITVKSLCKCGDINITANLQIMNNKLYFINAFNNSTGYKIDRNDLIIKEKYNKKYLLVFDYIYPGTGNLYNAQDVLLNCHNGNEYSILGLAALFVSHDNLLHFVICQRDSGNLTYTDIEQNTDITKNKISNTSSSDARYIKVIDNTGINIGIFNGATTVEKTLNSGEIEIYIDITNVDII